MPSGFSCDAAGEQFDQAVGAEGDERDRGGHQPGRERDPSLDAMPGEADPNELAGTFDEAPDLRSDAAQGRYRRKEPVEKGRTQFIGCPLFAVAG